MCQILFLIFHKIIKVGGLKFAERRRGKKKNERLKFFAFYVVIILVEKIKLLFRKTFLAFLFCYALFGAKMNNAQPKIT
jgi:hypothetical protein